MFKISFDFDETTKTVSNVKVSTVAKPIIPPDEAPTVLVEENKLVFSNKALELLTASAGDRIAINYIQVDNKTTFPIIAKSTAVFDINVGNKLTKTNTVSYKGSQRDILLLHGDKFELETYKPGIFKLKTIK